MRSASDGRSTRPSRRSGADLPALSLTDAAGLYSPAARLDGVEASPIRAVFDRASALEAEGAHVYHLEIGRPDFDSPACAKAAAVAALDGGAVHYGPNAGELQFREAIAASLARDHGLGYAASDEIVATIGANEAVFLAIMAFCSPGDDVIIPVPAWSAYAACVRLAGANPVLLELDQRAGYELLADAVERLMRPQTRMVVLCNPHNPTGAVTGEQRLAEIADLLRGTRVILLSDEIYADLVYGEPVAASATVSDLRERTITVGGMAKSYAMDGWRLGWLAGPAQFVRPAVRIRQYTTICPTTFAQLGAAEALHTAAGDREAMRVEFGERRNAALDILDGAKHLAYHAPDGAFYVYLCYPARHGLAADVASRLLEEDQVATVPGTAFGAQSGQHALRLSFACSTADVREGVSRITRRLQ
jgi:aspartate/methionine/tyrosine aminotransferase